MPKSILTFGMFPKVPKIKHIGPRCDFELKRDERLEPELWTFGSRGPQGAAPSTRTRQKKEGERQKERRTKKERVRKVEKGTKGFEHASGQRPGEFEVTRGYGAVPRRRGYPQKCMMRENIWVVVM